MVLHGILRVSDCSSHAGGIFQQTGAFAGADVCIYRSGAVGALSCGRHALAYGLGIFTQSWENPLMLAAVLVGILMQVAVTEIPF